MLVLNPVLSRKIKFFLAGSAVLVSASATTTTLQPPASNKSVAAVQFHGKFLPGHSRVSSYEFSLNRMFLDQAVALGQNNAARLGKPHPMTGLKSTKTRIGRELGKIKQPKLLKLPTSFNEHPLKTYESALAAQASQGDSIVPLDIDSIQSFAKSSLGISEKASTNKLPTNALEKITHYEKISNYAYLYGIPHSLFVALIDQESTFNSVARSSANAIGLGQMLPTTALWLTTGNSGPFKQEQIQSMEKKLEDPDFNLLLSARYLAYLLHENGSNLDKALAAYNAGLGSVRKYNGVPPFPQTKAYVQSVKAKTFAYFKLISEDPALLLLPKKSGNSNKPLEQRKSLATEQLALQQQTNAL